MRSLHSWCKNFSSDHHGEPNWPTWVLETVVLGTFSASSQNLVLRRSAALTSPPRCLFLSLNQVGKLILSCALGWLTRWRQYQRSAITGGSKPHPDQPTANNNLTLIKKNCSLYLKAKRTEALVSLNPLQSPPQPTNSQLKFNLLYLKLRRIIANQPTAN